jgi:hypothetical protein
MNVIDRLIRQHREMESALEATLQAEGEERRKLFEAAADVLMSHVLIEEQHFYPAVKSKRTEDVLLESLEEHLSLKRLLADLLELSVEDEHFEPKLHVLKEQSEHHHQEEEQKLFPKAKTLLSAEELETLGDSMARAQAALLEAAPRNISATQTQAAAPLR